MSIRTDASRTTAPPRSILVQLDGQVSSATEPFLRPDDLGILRGDGIFETALVIEGEPRDMPLHLARLQRSALMLDLPIPGQQEWEHGIRSALTAWSYRGESTLRLIATRGPEDGSAPSTCFILVAPLSPEIIKAREGISVLTLERGFSAEDVSNKSWLLTGAKTISYAMNMATLRYAKSQGADDAIFVDTDGYVLEGPNSTVILVRGNTLYTPPHEAILDGTTLEFLIRVAKGAGWQIVKERLRVDDLFEADSLYLTSSTRLLAPILSVNGSQVATDPDVTQQFSALLRIP